MLLAAPTPAQHLMSHQLLVFLLEIGLLLLMALLLGRLAVRLGLPAVVGELVAGVLVGPSLLGKVAPGVSGWLLPAASDQVRMLDVTAQLGALLLVGITGAELNLATAMRRRTAAIRVSLCGLLLPLGLGVAAGYVLPRGLLSGPVSGPTFALFLGVAMCVSAIPVIAKTLFDMNLMHRDVGQITLMAGTVDDAVGWFLLSVVSAMATVGVRAGQLAVSLLYLVGFVLLAVLVGRPLVRRVFRFASRTADPGAASATAVLVVLAGAAVTQALGLEAIFGAFVAGILIGLPGMVEPSRLAGLRTVTLAVFAPIFLATAGLRMDLGTLADPAVAASALAVLAIATLGKFGGAYLGARWSHLSRREGLALGAGMNSRGVVEIVVATVGLRLGVLNIASYTVIVLVAIVTSVTGPLLLRVFMAGIEPRPEERAAEPAPSTQPVVVVVPPRAGQRGTGQLDTGQRGTVQPAAVPAGAGQPALGPGPWQSPAEPLPAIPTGLYYG